MYMSEEEIYRGNLMDKEMENPENIDTPPQKKGITLELGDIIEIHASSNPEIHQETFFIIYLDDQKIRLANVSSFQPHTLRLDENGVITDESIQKIVLLNRSEVQGYARQHLLVPKTWVDIHFGGEVPTIITGEITNLEEDMIEVTTYPDIEVIYIDFQYKGIPEYIPLEQIVIRMKPASLEKIASLVNIREGIEEGEIFEPGLFTEDAASIEYNELGEAKIRLPKSVKPDETIRENLHAMYLSANEIIYGEELEDIVQRVEIPEHLKRYGIETQVNDMLDELLSEIPTSKRTDRVMENIHKLIERFRELRTQFSKFDTNGNVYDLKQNGLFHKPLVDRILALDRSLKWLIPVVSLRKKIYTSVHPETLTDVIPMNIGEVLNKDATDQQDYLKNRMNNGDVPSYLNYQQRLERSFLPFDAPFNPNDFLAPQKTIQTALEGIVQNLENFYSTVNNSSKENEGYAARRFVIQRYSLGQTRLQPTTSITGKQAKTVYIRDYIGSAEQMTIRSMVVMPLPVIQFQSGLMMGSSILKKSEFSQQFLYLFRLLHKRSKIQTEEIGDFSKDLDPLLWDSDDKIAVLRNKIREFVLDERFEQEPHRFQKFLNAMVPTIGTLIKLLEKTTPLSKISNLLSVKRACDALEPFMVYSVDLNYGNNNLMRHMIKTRLKEYKLEFSKLSEEMAQIRNVNYGEKGVAKPHAMERLLQERIEIINAYVDNYKLPTNQKSGSAPLSSSEWISKTLDTDNLGLLTFLIRFMMVSLVTPDNIMAILNENKTYHDDMYENEKIRATDCLRRVLTKKYSSMKDLQKENGTTDLYYDLEYDDTPYEIMKKYRDDQKRYSPEDFVDYLAENLIQKHDCPPALAKELAAALILGKKQVQEGEYAMVEIKPHLPANVDIRELSEKEIKEMELEANVKRQILFYRRKGTQWVHDDSVDDNSFVDSNTLFCNMGKICFRDPSSKTCESMEDAASRMKQLARKKLLNEFDGRFSQSVETLQDTLKNAMEKAMYQVRNLNRLSKIQTYRYNHFAYELARYAKIEDIVQSPHTELLNMIYEIDDFVQKQHSLVRFAASFCRDPMVDELGESFHWLYCKDTNTPLLPKFQYELARTFTAGENYIQKVNELCRKQGIEVGDSIVDCFTGRVIRKIDLVQEEHYDEAGSKIITSDVLEKDAGEQIAEIMSGITSGSKSKKDRVFEDPLVQMIFNVYAAIAENVSLPLDAVEDFVVRVSQEIITKNVNSKAVYEVEAAKIEKERNKRLPPYEIYYNKSVILIVAGVTLLAIQTAVPSFQIRKTYPGCVQSFRGYPFEGGASTDMSGLNYIACVLNKIKTSVKPWNSIKPIPLTLLQDQLKQTIEKTIVSRIDLMALYDKKREYMLLHPEEEEIDKEHSIQRWTGFLPPVVDFQILNSLRGLGEGYTQELVELQRTGNGKQRDQLAMFKTKCIQYGYGVVESINRVVKSKDLILKTASNMLFMENACCNDKNTSLALDYFVSEAENLKTDIAMVKTWENVLREVRGRSFASMLYHPVRTGIQYNVVPNEHFTENIYAAFIWYCNLDRELPIPDALRPLMSEKPAEYNPRVPMADKIEFFKSNGTPFSLTNLKQLMEIVNRQNVVQISTDRLKGTRISALREFLGHLENRENNQDIQVIEAPLRERLNAVLAKYNPRAMITRQELERSEETKRLNNYLSTANAALLNQIATFLQENGNLTTRKFNELEVLLSEIHIWNLDPTQDDLNPIQSGENETSMYTVTQFMKNSVHAMARIYPEYIRNSHTANSKCHAHWGFDTSHQKDISAFLSKSVVPLNRFKKDPVLTNLLKETQQRLTDLTNFLEHIPIFTPIHRDARKRGSKFEETETDEATRTFISLFDKRTLYMLYTYSWYSVLYEYIQATNDPELLQMDILEQREVRRSNIAENADPLNLVSSIETYDDDEMADDANDRMEVQIIAGDKKELKMRVADMLLAFLEIEHDNKKTLDLSYADISKRVNRSKQNEKQMITDYLKNMDNDERRTEEMLKMLKMGRWNVGLRKGLVEYDKAMYSEQRQQLINRLNDRTYNEDMDDVPIQRDIQDLERMDREETDAIYDEEAMDIRGLGEDYMDGEYYTEDRDDDDFGREE
jgi:hypothetical protein